MIGSRDISIASRFPSSRYAFFLLFAWCDIFEDMIVIRLDIGRQICHGNFGVRFIGALEGQAVVEEAVVHCPLAMLKAKVPKARLSKSTQTQCYGSRRFDDPINHTSIHDSDLRLYRAR